MQRPVVKNEINLTSAIAVAGFAITVGTMVWKDSGFRANVITWQQAHESYHVERARELTTHNVRTDERLKQVEGHASTIANLEYRMAVQEQGTTSLTAAVADLRQGLNDVSADIRLIREIVTRMDRNEQDTARE